MRGTSSTENAVAWASRSARTPSGSADGARKPTVTAPGLSRATSAGSSGRTCRTTSASASTSPSTTCRTDRAVRVVVRAATAHPRRTAPRPRARPATSGATVSGTAATRRSPGRVSAGTAIFIPRQPRGSSAATTRCDASHLRPAAQSCGATSLGDQVEVVQVVQVQHLQVEPGRADLGERGRSGRPPRPACPRARSRAARPGRCRSRRPGGRARRRRGPRRPCAPPTARARGPVVRQAARTRSNAAAVSSTEREPAVELVRVGGGQPRRPLGAAAADDDRQRGLHRPGQRRVAAAAGSARRRSRTGPSLRPQALQRSAAAPRTGRTARRPCRTAARTRGARPRTSRCPGPARPARRSSGRPAATLTASGPGCRKVAELTRVPSRIRLVSRASPARVTHESVGPGCPSTPIAR